MCENEKETAALEREESERFRKIIASKKYRALSEKSIVQDKTLLRASFDTYIAKTEEEVTNKQKAIACVERYIQGQAFNLWFNGSPGVGKSHLAMSMLHGLNERAHKDKSCLFIDLDEMLRRIRASFEDKSSKYTEQYFISLLCDVDYLVLDDLGAETGNIDTNKIASDFTSRVLRAVVNARQDKSTIITTNLSSEQLLKMYDPKLISRMMRHLETVIFKDTVDKRIKNIGF